MAWSGVAGQLRPHLRNPGAVTHVRSVRERSNLDTAAAHTLAAHPARTARATASGDTEVTTALRARCCSVLDVPAMDAS